MKQWNPTVGTTSCRRGAAPADRVEAGESITITVDGRPVAMLAPLSRRSRWVPKTSFVDTVLSNQADAGLTDDLRQLAGEMTDELPFP